MRTPFWGFTGAGSQWAKASQKNLTCAQFEEVMKRASEFALSDPYDGSSSLDEAEVLRIASEVGLPDKHVRRALAEVRSNEPPSGVVDRWLVRTIDREHEARDGAAAD